MILADTSIWVDHFRRGSKALEEYLAASEILMHGVVLGELAVGNLSRRDQVLGALSALPRAKEGTPSECLEFIEMGRLYGRGLGWNDVQLLVAARLSRIPLWSRDVRLNKAANELEVGFITR